MAPKRNPSSPRSTAPAPIGRFAAIDFETADYERDSACALAVVVVEGTEVVRQESFLIQPPRTRFVFTYIHGIRWQDVAASPRFRDLWPQVAPLFEGVEFLAAHNASFDRSVLYQCCHGSNVPWPVHPFQCTVKLARQAWKLKPATLPDVCRHLSIPLHQHHQAESDALACAQIVIAARKQGLPLSPWLGKFSGTLR